MNADIFNRVVKAAALIAEAAVVAALPTDGASFINAQASPKLNMTVFELPRVVVTAKRATIVQSPRVVVSGHRVTRTDKNMAEGAAVKTAFRS